MSTFQMTAAQAAQQNNRHTDGTYATKVHGEQDTFVEPEPARETTLQKFNSPSQRGNYCKLPTEDVEILDDVRHCARCHVELLREGTAFSGRWVHVDDPKACDSSYVTPQESCRYCNNDAPGTVKYRAEAWADITACTRCGGETGYALGD